MNIAIYTFNSSTDILPEFTFNSYEYTFIYSDVNNGDGTITRTITSDSSPTSISFNGKTGLISVSYLDTSNVTDMASMFYNCTSLTSLDLSDFDTSSVTNMGYMFAYCSNLTTLDVSNWDTSNVTNMSHMFYSCSNLITLDLSNWDISNVTLMNFMFDSCTNLISIDLSSFNTSNISTMYGMFNYCTNLTTINMNNSDVDSINDIISYLPTRTTDSYGTIIVSETVLNLVDTTTANSKYWKIIKTPKYSFTLDTLKYLLTTIKSKFITKEEINNKVDKVEGKKLSANNFSDEDVNNINNSFDDAEVNQSGTTISFYSTSADGVKTKIKDIDLDI